MKEKILIILFIASVTANSYVNGQNSSLENEAEKMIEEFYIKYCNTWKNMPSSANANVLYEKIDSLMQNYCTKRLQEKSKSWFEDGHDLLTNDWGIDLKSLNTISVEKDLAKSSSYIVTYFVETYPVSPDKPVKKRITLHVSVIKEEGIYKINEVY